MKCPTIHFRLVRALLAVLLLAASAPAATDSMPAQEGFVWPRGIDTRLELTINNRQSGRCHARVADFEAISLIVPEHVRVFDDAGLETTTAMTQDKSGRRELWFVVNGDASRRYFIEWSAPQDIEPGKITRPRTAATGNRDTASASGPSAPPDSWPRGAPTVEARAGEMTLHPGWLLRRGELWQVTRRPNEFLVSRDSLGDFTLDVRVKPIAGKHVGIAVRIGDAETPFNSGVLWLVGVTNGRKESGFNKVSGLAKDSADGPTLPAEEWSDLRVIATESAVSFWIDGRRCKIVTLPEGEALAGHIALVTDAAEAAFADLRITDARTGDALWSDTFTGGPYADANRWLNVTGKPARGFMRVVNHGASRGDFQCDIRIHREPWTLRNLPIGASAIEPKHASPWVWIRGLDAAARAPLTLEVGPAAISRNASEKPQASVELYGSLADMKPARSLKIGGEPVIVEINNLDMRQPGDVMTPDEIGAATLAAVKAMSFKGKRPERFPAGSAAGTPADLEAGRALGFNVMSGPPRGFDVESFNRLGYRYVDTFTHLLSTKGQGYGYNRETNERDARDMAEAWRRLGLAEKVRRVSVFDEALASIDRYMRNDGALNIAGDPNAWSQMIAKAGLRVTDFAPPGTPAPPSHDALDRAYWSRLRATPLQNWNNDREGVRKSLSLLNAIWPTRFGNAREAIHAAFGRPVEIAANIHVTQYLRHGFGVMDPWSIYAKHKALDVPQSCDYFIGYPQNEEFLIDMQRAALLGRDAPVDACLASQSRYLARSPRSLELRGISALAAGARSLTYYQWGPRWRATENWFSDQPARLEAIGRINHAAGFVEDVLLEGKPVPGQVAMLVSPISDAWSYTLGDAVDYVAERRRWHHLMRSLQIQTDFLHESMFPSDAELDRYKLIVIAQPCMPDTTAKRLLTWAERGGTLVALGAYGQMDELCRRTRTMPEAFGVYFDTWLEAGDRAIAVADTVTLAVPVPIVSAKVVDAEKFARFSEQEVAITTRRREKGELVFFTFLPGQVYHRVGTALRDDVVLGMDAGVRTLVERWTARAGPPRCEADNPLVSVRLIESPRGSVIFIINSTGAPLDKVTITVRQATASKATSLQLGAVSIATPEVRTIRVEMPVKLWDVLRLE